MASAVILLPFYIAYLPTEVYGALSVCLAFSMLVQILVTYSFDTSLYIHYHELKHDTGRLAQYVSSAFLFMLLLGVVVGVVLSATGQLVFTWILPQSTIAFFPYGLVSVGVGIFQALFKVHGNLLQTREKPETYLWSNVVSFAIIAIFTIAGLKLYPGSLVGPLGARLLAGALTTGWVLVRVFGEFGVHLKSPWSVTSFSFNAYTFVYQLQQWAINYIDRFLLLFFMPLAAVGVYDFALKCLVPVELLLNGLNSTINPKVIKLINGQTQKGATAEINRYFYGLVSAIMLAICISILFIPGLVDMFVNKSGYADAVHYLPYLAVVYIFKAMRLYFVLPYAVLKKMKEITVLNFFISALKIGLLAWLIGLWGLYGVVVSACAAYAVELVFLWIYLKEDYILRFNAFKLIVAPLLVLALIVLVEPLAGREHTLQAHAAYGVLCMALLWFAYRNELRAMDFFKMIR